MIRSVRRIRIGLATVVFALITAAFIAPDLPLVHLSRWLIAAQAAPAWLSLSGGFGIGLVCLVSLTFLTALTGRTYCAVLCPLGIAFDICRFAARKVPFLRKLQDNFRGPSAEWRHSIRLAILCFALALGLVGALAVIDPYSIWGRTATLLLRPALVSVQGVLAALLEKVDIYTFSGQAPHSVPIAATLFAAVSALVLAFLGALAGRIYCTTICPIGTFLAGLSKKPWCHIKVDRDACTSCGLCSRRCRTRCISPTGAKNTPEIAVSDCVMCGECIAICPTNALSYARHSDPVPVAELSESAITPTEDPVPPRVPRIPTRRNALFIGGSVIAGAVTARLIPDARSEMPGATPPPSPPGSISYEHLHSLCTACQRCLSACPTRVIQPSIAAYGMRGFLQPLLSFQHGYCEFDCTRCGDVCPTGAIQSLDLEEKHREQIGTVTLHKNRCLVYLMGEDCGACAELCPTHAVHTVERDGLMYPETAPEACVGCGACEHVCPQSPKAITVTACKIHGKAGPPHSTAPEVPVTPMVDDASEEEFPF